MDKLILIIAVILVFPSVVAGGFWAIKSQRGGHRPIAAGEHLGSPPNTGTSSDTRAKIKFSPEGYKISPQGAPLPSAQERAYAAAAMQGMLSHATRYRPRAQDSGLDWHDALAKEAFEIAAAMVKREKLNAEW